MNKKNWLFFFLILFIYWLGFLPGIKGANDLPYSSIAYLKNLLVFPSAWSSLNGPFGQNQLSTLWSYPSGVLYGLEAYLGLSVGLIVAWFGLFPVLAIGFISMNKYSSLFVKADYAKGIATFFFLVNSYILLIIDGGQLLWALAYAVFPYCLYQIEKKIQTNQYKFYFRDILGVMVLSFCDFRAVYLLGLWCFLRLSYQLIFLPKNYLRDFLKFTAIFGIMNTFFMFLTHSFWLVPLAVSRSSIIPNNLNLSTTADYLQFTSLGHAIFFQQPHWFKNIFGEISTLNPFFIIIPILAFSPLMFKKKNQAVGFLFIIALTGIFLVKGTQPPFGFVYKYFFEIIPGFFLFRDSTKFFVFVAVAYSVLCGITVQYLLSIKKEVYGLKIGYLLLVGVVIYFTLLYSPVFTNQMSGLLGKASDYDDFSKLEKSLSYLPEGKVLWVPSKPALAYSDPRHLSVNAVDLIKLRPFATGIHGTYETLNFLREASFSGELLKVSGIRYIGYAPLSPRKDYKADQIAYHQVFLDQLKNRTWVKSQNNIASIPVLELEKNEGLFFIPRNSYLVIGSDSIYGDSTKSAETSLTNNGFIFVEEQQSVSQLIEKNMFPIYLNKKTQIDLLMHLLPNTKIYFPAKSMSLSPDKNGWWKRESGDFLTFKDFLINKYGIYNQDFDLGGGWAIAEGSRKLVIPLEVKKGEQVFIRALESTRSGTLKVEDINVIDLQKSGNGISWLQVGVVKQDAVSLVLTTSGDITILNAVKVVTSNELDLANQKISTFSVTSSLDLSPSERPTVQFVKYNDSEYLVKVRGVKKTSLLVFAQSYDPKWQLDGAASIPVYSIFNGFRIDRDGDYFVRYKPQKYMFLGGLISAGGLLTLLGSVVYIYYGKKVKKLV